MSNQLPPEGSLIEMDGQWYFVKQSGLERKDFGHGDYSNVPCCTLTEVKNGFLGEDVWRCASGYNGINESAWLAPFKVLKKKARLQLAGMSKK